MFTPDNIQGTVITTSAGTTWQRFNACHMTINKTAIESDPLYANMSPTTRAVAVRVLIAHQLGHCAGLAQASTQIMSASTLAPVTNLFLDSELSDLQNYRP